MTQPPSHIFDVATTLRDTVETLYLNEGISLPTRRYISDGAVAWDCELMAVELTAVFRGPPLSPVENFTQRCMGVRTARFNVWIVRCASTPNEDGSPPATHRIEALADDIYTDAWFLPTQLAQAAMDGTLGIPCDDLVIGELEIVGPEGGFGGVRQPVEWQLGAS